MRISGVILDIYDDPKGEVLVGLLDGTPLPEKLASARLLESHELESLPDRLFGLVADNGPTRLRKYAMCDEAHLATSILYFLKKGEVLPEIVQTKVAANLVNACAWYDMDPPEPLVKRAMLGKALGGLGTAALVGLGAMEVKDAVKETNAKNRQANEAFRAAQVSGAKVASGREIELSLSEEQSIDGTVEMQNRKLVSGADPYAGRVLSAAQQISQRAPSTKKLDRQMESTDQIDPFAQKQADLNGTEMMPYGMSSKPVRNNPSKKVAIPAKTAAGKVAARLIDEGHQSSGDIRGFASPARAKRASYQRFALPTQKRYPIDTVAHVKTAAAYFDEHMTEFGLEDRRLYAQSLALRAEELGVSLGGEALKYAGSDYGPYIDSELVARIRSFEGTGHEAAYEVLREKRAGIAPPVMVEMLKEADRATGADAAYGRVAVGFRDPYQAVYGKTAQEEAKLDKQDTYSWSQGTDYVSGMQLSALSASGADLDETFGKGFTEKFRKDPVGMFSSLPDPHKVLLSRLASDNSEVRPQI